MSELQDTADHLVVIGRGRLIADTAVSDLIEAASGDQVVLHTTKRSEATAVLANAGATVTVDGRDALSVSGLPGDQIAALLSAGGVPFSELRRRRASLEEAYMDLTRDAVEFNTPMVQEA
jgi:ABC-2 type transport system ATP-binding protein